MTWMRWEQRVRGKSRETGEPVMCMEFVPHTGTRAEFMEEYIAKFEEWMLHVYRDRNFKFMSRLQLERMSSPEQMATPTMMVSRVDFATAVEILRMFSETCSFPERFNVCCTVVVYRPRVVQDYRQRRQWGKKKVGQPVTPATSLPAPTPFIRLYRPLSGCCCEAATSRRVRPRLSNTAPERPSSPLLT